MRDYMILTELVNRACFIIVELGKKPKYQQYLIIILDTTNRMSDVVFLEVDRAVIANDNLIDDFELELSQKLSSEINARLFRI